MNYLNNTIITSLVLISFLFTNDKQVQINKKLDLYYIASFSDFEIINLPFRIIDINYKRQSGDFELYSNLALELNMRTENYFLENSSISDFDFDLRELYLTWYSSFGEVKVGKQIHTWGNVDENSPIDNASPFDYNYLFFKGKEKKLATFSSVINVYLDDWKFSSVFSPVHNTSRIPLKNSESPISVPVYPKEIQMISDSDCFYDPDELNESLEQSIEDKTNDTDCYYFGQTSSKPKPFEFGLYADKAFDFGNIQLSYFKGYDRIFNLGGLNVYEPVLGVREPSEQDTVFSYRQTEVLGLGGTFFLGNLTLRTDLGLFNTSAQDSTIKRKHASRSDAYPYWWLEYNLNEKAQYYQSTIQVEYPLPFEINFTGQYATWDTLSYSRTELPIEEAVDLPLFSLDPDYFAESFIPGMGTALSFLTKKALIFAFDKKFINNKLQLTMSSLTDIQYIENDITGSLINVDLDYNISESLNFLIGITKVNGHSNHPKGSEYTFNLMEDFSHLRTQLKYFF